MIIDELKFAEARAAALVADRENDKVGTLSEKLVHRVIKHYIQPDATKHEQKMCGKIVDVINDGEIYEIQTRGFEKLVPKLDSLLREHSVTVVYPVIKEKNLIWIDPETGEASVPKRVSKKGKISDVLPELSKIDRFVGHENFKLIIMLLCADEFRYLDGYGKDKKLRATKINVIPNSIVEVVEITSRDDCKMLLSAVLPDVFSSKQLFKSLGMQGRKASFALAVMKRLGLCEVLSKEGNSYIYQKK